MRGNARSNNTSQTSLSVGAREQRHLARAAYLARRGPTVCQAWTCGNIAFFCRSDRLGSAGRTTNVQNPDPSLDFGRRDLVLLDLLIKRAARDPEPPRGFLDAASFLQ